MESAHTINVLLSQYATDNNGVYPVGEGTNALGKSEGIALDLLQNNFTPNPDIFTVGSTPNYRGAAKDFSDLAAANLSWDFTAGATTGTGITSTAPDFLPVVYTTGETVLYPTPGKGLDLMLSGQGPFADKGVVVVYKIGNARFIPAVKSESGKAFSPGFISPDFKDTGTYTQIRP